MASLVQAPIKLLKWLIVPEAEPDDTEYYPGKIILQSSAVCYSFNTIYNIPESLVAAAAADDNLPSLPTDFTSGDRACIPQCHSSEAAAVSAVPTCKPTTIITR